MDELSKTVRSALNNPAEWDESTAQPYFDVKGYQKRLDRIIPRNRDNQSALVLRWAPTVRTSFFGSDMPEFWWARYKRDGEFRYKLVPRWVFMERMEYSTYADAWEAKRYSMKDEDGRIVDSGPAPREMFVFKAACAVHDELSDKKGFALCCSKTETKQNSYRRCWGLYREPNDADLEAIAEGWKIAQESKHFNPYEPMTPEHIEYVAANARYNLVKSSEQYDSHWWDVYMDQVNLWGYRTSSDDPAVAHHGNKHFPYLHKTDSGLWVPNDPKPQTIIVEDTHAN